MLWLIHLVLPLVLLVCLAFWPARHGTTRALQIAGTAASLFALHLAGLWIMLPWWTPWVYWALFTLALWHGRGFAHRARFSGADAVIALLWATVVGAGAWLAFDAYAARTPPAGEMAELTLPLSRGEYLVASGGSREILSAHIRTLPRRTIGQRNYWGQSYGVDMIPIGRWGFPADSNSTILSPCDGRVVRAEDGFADGRPIDLQSPTARAGNHAQIRCSGFDILLAHFRQGSLKVEPGDEVRTGQPLALLGNSGASDMPHLHIHAQRPGTDAAPFSGQPVPMRVAGRYLVRGDRL
jgi:hypothetical protein